MFRKSAARQRKMPPARVISDLIVKALRAKRTHDHYSAGMMAGLMLFLRRHLPIACSIGRSMLAAR
jgi:hypothetical protein